MRRRCSHFLFIFFIFFPASFHTSLECGQWFLTKHQGWYKKCELKWGIRQKGLTLWMTFGRWNLQMKEQYLFFLFRVTWKYFNGQSSSLLFRIQLFNKWTLMCQLLKLFLFLHVSFFAMCLFYYYMLLILNTNMHFWLLKKNSKYTEAAHSHVRVPPAGHDCSVRLWMLDNRTCVQEITAHRKKHDEAIHDVAFHASQPFIASAGADALAKIFVWQRWCHLGETHWAQTAEADWVKWRMFFNSGI